MPKGELFFRKYDANGNVDTQSVKNANGESYKEGWVDMYDKYGISFSETSLSKLVTPAPNKEAIENKSRRQDGKRVIRKPKYAKKDERTVDLEMHLSAQSESDFWKQFTNFCDDFLDDGFFDIKVSFRPNNVYRMTYLSCTQFSEFMQELAKFTLRLNEPDPTNRGINDAWATKTAGSGETAG